MEVHADKDTKGFNWNNPMLQRWIDPMVKNIEYLMIMNVTLH